MIPDSLVIPVRFTLALLALFLCVSIANTSINMMQQARKFKGEAPTRTVTLTGTGSVDAAPTKATIVVSVYNEGEKQADVQSEGNTTMAAVQTAVKALGVEDADIQTNSYSLSPQYDYTSGVQKTTGYQLSQSIEVTVRTVDQLSAIIDAATAAGANSVSTPQFTIDEEDTLKDEARSKAADEVAAQRTSYENTLGVQLGEIVTIQESNGDSVPVPIYAAGVAEKGDVSTSAPIESGSNTVSVTLSVTYALQ